MCGITSPTTLKLTGTWPPITSLSSGAPPSLQWHTGTRTARGRCVLITTVAWGRGGGDPRAEGLEGKRGGWPPPTSAPVGTRKSSSPGRYSSAPPKTSIRLAVLRRLRAANPSATIIAVATPGHCFLGATPERLVRLAGRDVEVTCLAGSIARGATESEDEQLASTLLSSAKDRTEHEVVVRSTQAALATVCSEVIRAPGTPRVARSRSVQHLATPLRGRLANGGCVLDLVDRLHPTPAVGGFPRDVALSAIREREGIDRGWYAGPSAGSTGPGDGEFAVAIRSALLAGREATLYAGSGIVADSDPEAEYAETCLKLEPMLAALGMQ